jgi:hypothetical protein
MSRTRPSTIALHCFCYLSWRLATFPQHIRSVVAADLLAGYEDLGEERMIRGLRRCETVIFYTCYMLFSAP